MRSTCLPLATTLFFLILFLVAVPARLEAEEGSDPLNLALAGSLRQGTERALALVVDEHQQGLTDLNADGDVGDQVVFVHDALTGETRNTGAAASRFFTEVKAAGSLVAFVVGEEEQGQTSLNEDGPLDIDDEILFIHDVRTGATIDTGLAVLANAVGFGVGRDLVAFAVVEKDQGRTDLNGDGDTDDIVVHVFDAITGEITNLGLAGLLEVEGRRVALLVSEMYQGFTDLNGDGDASDTVLHVFDADTGTTTNMGFAVDQPYLPSSGTLMELPFEGDVLVVRVSEASQSGLDLNGDGDAEDRVVHVLDVNRGTVLNLGVAVSRGIETVFRDTLEVGVAVDEAAQGNTDLNSDGDALDFVLHVLESSPLRLANKALALDEAGIFRVGHDSLLVVSASEEDQGTTDLNSDGDASDDVFFLYDSLTDSLTNLGLATRRTGGDSFRAGWRMTRGRLAALRVSEGRQGFSDLNGDGDHLDHVLFVHDAETGETRNLGLQCAPGPLDLTTFRLDEAPFRMTPDRILFRTQEAEQGADLDGDGDLTGEVLHLFDRISGLPIGLGLDAGEGARFLGDHLVFSRRETADRNGDGDSDDLSVLIGRLDPDRGIGGGSVNGGAGAVVPVLFVNDRKGIVTVAARTEVELRLDAPPGAGERYLLWVWTERPSTPRPLEVRGASLGALVLPSPFQAAGPFPTICLRSGSVADLGCGNASTRLGPHAVPWSLSRPQGLPPGSILTIQGVIEDGGAAHPSGFSVTNAVLVQTIGS